MQSFPVVSGVKPKLIDQRNGQTSKLVDLTQVEDVHRLGTIVTELWVKVRISSRSSRGRLSKRNIVVNDF